MKCFLRIQQKSSNGVSEGGIRLRWGITAADETSHERSNRRKERSTVKYFLFHMEFERMKI